MATLSKQQLRKIYTLIRQQDLVEMKDSLVSQYTNGRTTHASEMTYAQAGDLLSKLAKGDPLQKMRRKVRAIAHDLGWLVKGLHEYNGYVIDRFLKERGVCKKPLMKMDKAELAATVTQFEKIKLHNEHQDWRVNELDKTLEEFGIEKASKKPSK